MRIIAAGSILVAGVLALTGCVPGQSSSPADSSITVAQRSDANSLDNVLLVGGDEYNIALNIYDLLMAVDDEGALQPALATEAVQSSPNVWTIALREDVTFHDGSPFDAEDVKWSIERALDPDIGSSQRSYIATIESVAVLDALTVEVTTQNPDPTLMMAMQMVPIGSKEYFESVGADTYGLEPVGTGPYSFVERVPGESVSLEAYPEHWRGEAKISEVEFRVIPDESSIVSALRTGDVDLITNVNPDLAPTIESAGQLKVLTVPSNRSLMVTLDSSVAPFDKLEVRQALQYATNVEAITTEVLGGYANAVPTLLAPVYLGFNENLEPHPYDPARSAELLEEAGYPDGVSFKIYAPSGRYMKDSDVAQALVEQWKSAGFDVELELVEWANFLTKYVEKSLGTYLIGYGTPIFDSGRGFMSYVTCDTFGSSYCDPALDSAIAEAVATPDDSERAELYRDVNVYLYDNATHVFLYQQTDIYGANASLKWNPRPDERVWLYSAELS